MWRMIEKHVGKYFTFRIDGIAMSGFFCGIGKHEKDYGMIFLTSDGKDASNVSCLFVHPLRVKCTLQTNMLSLRKYCRKLFKKHNLKNTLSDIYHPAFEIKEITKRKEIINGQ